MELQELAHAVEEIGYGIIISLIILIIAINSGILWFLSIRFKLEKQDFTTALSITLIGFFLIFMVSYVGVLVEITNLMTLFLLLLPLVSLIVDTLLIRHIYSKTLKTSISIAFVSSVIKVTGLVMLGVAMFSQI
jgi:hypothetical protein